MKVVIASGNAHKIVEIQRAMPAAIELVSQQTFNVTDAVESGLSFVENAIIKARHAAALTGLPALADDSGLEVTYLDGAPGIYSARFAGEHATDADNNQKLLQAMKTVPQGKRGARFRCVIVMMQHAADPSPIIATGTWQGEIALGPSGDHGFGYDPLFYLSELGKTAAQLSREEKNTRSHRGIALRQLQGLLTQ